MNWLRNFEREECGATAVEYAVVLMLIAGACISVIQLVGSGSGSFWAGNQEAIDNILDSQNSSN